MPALNIIKGDTVLVRRGKDKGKRGTVKSVFPKDGSLTVEGINVIKRHTKAGAQGQQSAGIYEKEAPLPASAVMYVCGKCSKPSRVKHKVTTAGSQRVCGKCGEPALESAKGR